MRNKKLFACIFLINFFITCGYGVVDAFFPLYVFTIGGSGLMLGLPIALYAAAKIFFSVPLGRLADRFDKKNMMIFAVGLYLFTSLGYLVFQSIVILTALRILQAVACSIFRPVMLTWLNKSIKGKRYASVSGLFDISFYGALAIGPFLGGLIKNSFGFHGLFVFLMLLCLCAFAVSVFFLPSSVDIISGESGEVSVNKKVLSIKIIALMVFIYGRAFCISATVAFLPIYSENILKLNSVKTGILLSASTVTMTLLLRPFGMAADLVSRYILIFTGGICASLLCVFIPFAGSFTGVLAVCVMTGVFSAMSQPPSTAMLLEEGSRCGIGRAAGYFNLSMNAGFVSGPLLGALISEHIGLDAVFRMAGITGVLSVAVFLGLMTYSRTCSSVSDDSTTNTVYKFLH